MSVMLSLLILPYGLNEAFAYPLENYELKFDTTFTHNDISDLEPIMDWLDDTTQLHNIFFESFSEVAVGQFVPEDIEADWGLSYSRADDLWSISFDPTIIYINIASGVNHADIQDQALDDGRNQMGLLLNSFGITSYNQTVYYEGGNQTFVVSP